MNIHPIINSNYNNVRFSSNHTNKKYDDNGFEKINDYYKKNYDNKTDKSATTIIASSFVGAAILGVLFLPSFYEDNQIKRGMQKFEEEIFDSYSLDDNELSNNYSVNNQTKEIKFESNDIDVISEFKDMVKDIIEY